MGKEEGNGGVHQWATFAPTHTHAHLHPSLGCQAGWPNFKYLTKLNIRRRSGTTTRHKLNRVRLMGSRGCLLMTDKEEGDKEQNVHGKNFTAEMRVGKSPGKSKDPGAGWGDWSTYLLRFAERLMNLTWQASRGEIFFPHRKKKKKSKKTRSGAETRRIVFPGKTAHPIPDLDKVCFHCVCQWLEE